MAAAAEGSEEVLLESEDGVEFVVSEPEAIQSRVIKQKIWRRRRNIVSTYDDGGYNPISLIVQGKTLSKIVQYWKKHASGVDDPDWDAEFIDVDPETLCDLVWASHDLQVQGLLDLACRTLDSKIKGKSPHEICNILNIRNVLAPEINQGQSSGCCARQLKTLAAMMSNGKTCVSHEPQLVKKALWALHFTTGKRGFAVLLLLCRVLRK